MDIPYIVLEISNIYYIWYIFYIRMNRTFLYEIDNLIHILEKFKKECPEHIGEWR